MIFTIVFGFVIFPLGMVLANYYFLPPLRSAVS